jgi:hypothetical protein
MATIGEVLHAIVNLIEANATHKDEIHQAIDDVMNVGKVEKKAVTDK